LIYLLLLFMRCTMILTIQFLFWFQPGVFDFFGNGWCRDSKKNMYDYLRFYIQDVTPQICQDKCIDHWEGLAGISTYQSTYCYCWFDDSQLPSKLPSDIHGYSSRFKGAGEVTLTLKDDGDCYKFIENVVDTLTPTLMPTDSPSLSPTRKPTAKPTSAPTAKPTVEVKVVSRHLLFSFFIISLSHNILFLL
jgi:hypothetical protein